MAISHRRSDNIPCVAGGFLIRDFQIIPFREVAQRVQGGSPKVKGLLVQLEEVGTSYQNLPPRRDQRIQVAKSHVPVGHVLHNLSTKYELKRSALDQSTWNRLVNRANKIYLTFQALINIHSFIYVTVRLQFPSKRLLPTSDV